MDGFVKEHKIFIDLNQNNITKFMFQNVILAAVWVGCLSEVNRHLLTSPQENSHTTGHNKKWVHQQSMSQLETDPPTSF